MSEEDLPFDPKKESEPVELQDLPLPTYEEKLRVIIPTGWYEAEITEAGVVPNPFYDPNEQAEVYQNQLQVHFKVMDEGKEVQLRTWTSLALSPGGGKGKKSYLWTLQEAMGIDPKTFNGKPSDFVGKKIRISVETIDKDGEKMNVITKGKFETI